ncbi:response regulator [Aquabacterium sp.]|uniref:response regulator n=1 Tax=Aquabacterium sp. TaxID=1872578 RepID=UPI0035B13C0E
MGTTPIVLLVDDSRISRMMSRQYIAKKHPDWQIEEAGTGEEAIDKANQFEPFLILLDVNMPGMGGIAAAEVLRTAHPLSNIFLVTANVQEATRKKASDLCLGFAEKPMTEPKMHALLNTLKVI